MGAYTRDSNAGNRFGTLDPEDPDLQTVESFVEACYEDEEEEFDWQVLAVLAWNLRQGRRTIRAELESYGLVFQDRANVRRIRTLKDNPHDRWYGLGSMPTHGGSGWEQITGFAGQEG